MSSSTQKPKRPRKGSMQPTIADVAREAEVSAITVSRVLNAPASVRAKTRARVEAAIDKVGYVRNMLAGSLASANSRFIAVVVPSLSNIVFIEVIKGLQSEFEKHGYQILLGNTDYDLERECQLVRTFLGWSSSALVISGLRHNDACQRILREMRVKEFSGKPYCRNHGTGRSSRHQRWPGPSRSGPLYGTASIELRLSKHRLCCCTDGE